MPVTLTTPVLKLLAATANADAIRWALAAAKAYGLSRTQTLTLAVVAARTRFRAWNRMTDCIDRLRRLAKVSRRSCQAALLRLREIGLLAVDGYGERNPEHPEWRQVVFYRLAGTPECPLPGDVHCAREGHDWDREGAPSVADHATCLTCGFTLMTNPQARAVESHTPTSLTRGASPTSSSQNTPISTSVIRSEAKDHGQKGALLRRNHSTRARDRATSAAQALVDLVLHRR